MNSSSFRDPKRILGILLLLAISQVIILILIEVFIGAGIASTINIDAWRYSIIGIIGLDFLFMPILIKLRNKKILQLAGEVEEDVHSGFKKAVEVSEMGIILVDSQNTVKWVTKSLSNVLKIQGIDIVGEKVTKINKGFLKAFKNPSKPITVETEFHKIYEVVFSPKEMTYFCQDKTDIYGLYQELVENRKVVCLLSVESSIRQENILGISKAVQNIIDQALEKTSAIYYNEEALLFNFIMSSNDLKVIEDSKFELIMKIKALFNANDLTTSITFSIVENGNSFRNLKNLAFNNLAEKRSFGKTRIIFKSAIKKGIKVYELEGENFIKVGKQKSVRPVENQEVEASNSNDIESLRQDSLGELNAFRQEREAIKISIGKEEGRREIKEYASKVVEVPEQVEINSDGTPEWLKKVLEKNEVGYEKVDIRKPNLEISSSVIREMASVKEVVIYTRDIKQPEVLAASLVIWLIAKTLGKSFLAYSIIPPDFHHSIKNKITTLGGGKFVKSLIDTYELKRKTLDECLIVVLQTDGIAKDSFQHSKSKKYSYIGKQSSNGLSLLISNIKKDVLKLSISNKEYQLLQYIEKKINENKAVEFKDMIAEIGNNFKSQEEERKQEKIIRREAEAKREEQKNIERQQEIERQKEDELKRMNFANEELKKEAPSVIDNKSEKETEVKNNRGELFYQQAKLEFEEDLGMTVAFTTSNIKAAILTNLLEIKGNGFEKRILVSYVPQYISSTPKEIDEVAHELLGDDIGAIVVYTKLYNNKNVGMIYSYRSLDACELAKKLGDANGSKVKATYELKINSFETAKKELLKELSRLLARS